MADDVETERGRLEAELMRIGMSHGMPDAATQAYRNSRIAEIQAQLAALPRPAQVPRPPPGQRIEFPGRLTDGRLGTDAFARPGGEGEHYCSADYNPYLNSPTASRDRD